MRSLAEFVMRGPKQAVLAAALLQLFPMLFWLGSAVVGLVVLRRGLNGAAIVVLAALVPAVGWGLAGNLMPLAVLVVTLILAELLGRSHSWIAALMAALPLSVVSGWLVLQTLPQRQELQDAINQMAQTPLADWEFVAMMAGSLMLQQILVLLLSRWWQAQLYNPGGLQQELHQLRLPKPIMVLLVLLLLGCSAQAPAFIALVSMPLIMAAACLVHWLVKQRNLSGGWLVGFYLLLMLLTPIMTPLMITLACVDSLTDLRSKLQNGAGGL